MDRDMLKAVGAAMAKLDDSGAATPELVSDISSTMEAAVPAFEFKPANKGLGSADLQALIVQVMTAMLLEGYTIAPPKRARR